MAVNTNGFSGVDTKMVSDDSFTIVGIDPNIDPSVVIDDSGRSRADFTASTTEGMTKWPTAYPEVKTIDNSGAHHGGTYTIVAMNKFVVDAAGGGISLNSSGNITLNGFGGVVNILATAQIEMLSNIVKIDSSGFTIINGPKCDINSKILTINNLAIFANNVLVNGGMMVKGELYTTHITGMKEKFYTKRCQPQAVYFKPDVKISGIMNITNVAPSSPYMPNSAMCNIELVIPNPLMLTQPCAYSLPHRHRFYHLAADLCSSPDEVWEQCKDIDENAKLKKPKAANNFIKQTQTFVEDKVKDITLTMAKQSLF